MISLISKIKTIFCVLIIMVLFILNNPVSAQNDVPKKTQRIAQKTLNDYLKTFITEKNFKKFGFKKYEEVSSARLGPALPERFIRLKDLQSFDPQSTPKNIMRDARTLWFPVFVDTLLITKFELVKKKTTWIGGELGGIKAVQIIGKVRKKLSKLIEKHQVKNPSRILLLKIPALNADFIFFETEDGLFMMPAMIQPQRYQLENGTIYPATALLVKLKDYAKKINPEKLY